MRSGSAGRRTRDPGTAQQVRCCRQCARHALLVSAEQAIFLMVDGNLVPLYDSTVTAVDLKPTVLSASRRPMMQLP